MFQLIKWHPDHGFLFDESEDLVKEQGTVTWDDALKAREESQWKADNEELGHGVTLWEYNQIDKDGYEGESRIINGLDDITILAGCTIHSIVKSHNDIFGGSKYLVVYLTAPSKTDAEKCVANMFQISTNSSGYCGHEHDCCGCWSTSGAQVRYLGGGRYRINQGWTENV